MALLYVIQHNVVEQNPDGNLQVETLWSHPLCCPETVMEKTTKKPFK